MMSLGLSSAEMDAYLATLADDHFRRTRIELLTTEHDEVMDLSASFKEGQVEIDATAEVTRSASVTLLDPDHKIGLDSRTPGDSQTFFNRMLRAWVDVWVDALDRYVSVCVITGPITGVTRDRETITVEVQGKETLAKGPLMLDESRVFRRGSRRVLVIRELLRMSGERHYLMPTSWPAPLAKDLTIKPTWQSWAHAVTVAESMGAQLFYDGRGWARLRMAPLRSQHSFSHRIIEGEPQIAHSTSELKNAITVTGGVPPKGKRKATAFRSIPPWHRFSPERLGRNGGDRYLPAESVEDDTLKSQSAVDAVADRRVKEMMMIEGDVTFNCLPVYHLDPLDPVSVWQPGWSMRVQLSKATIPLAGGLMSVGYLRDLRHWSKRRATR